jgi:hypothetical protein
VIANVGSRWEGGKLVFFSKKTGNTIATFDPDNDRFIIAGFGPAENQADSTADNVADLVNDFNVLLTKLKAAGLMESDS